MTITPGRTCSEAPQYAVADLQAMEATLTSSVVDDCLAPQASPGYVVLATTGTVTGTPNPTASTIIR